MTISLAERLDSHKPSPEKRVQISATYQNPEVLATHSRGLRFMRREAMERGYNWSGGLALAMWPTGDDVEPLDAHPGTRTLAVVPFRLREVEPCVRALRAVDLCQPQPRG